MEEIQGIVQALSHLAWADGKLDPREEQMLRQVFGRFGLGEAETQAALAPQQGKPNFKTLATLIPSPAGRKKLVKMLLELSFADDLLTFEEYRMIEKVSKQLAVSDDDLEELRSQIVASQP